MAFTITHSTAAAWLGGSLDRGRSKKEIEEDRKRFGIHSPALEVIAKVAYSQYKRLEVDKQKQYEELSRELELRKIEWDTRYMELLAEERERLIDREIRAIFARQRDDEEIMLMLLAVAVE